MAINSFINNGEYIKSGQIQLYNSYLMESSNIKILTLKNEETGEEDLYAMNLKALGSGKFGKVYKATNWPQQTKIFAVKVIELTSEEVRNDYLKELKIIKNLPDCPNIVKTYKQHLQSQKNLYIFQEYCESGTLFSYKMERLGVRFSEYEIYDVFFQTTNGLIFLLESGIVHEDIKPANILKKGPLFKLCDFGVSQITNEYVQSTIRKGTISYMPPEKLKLRNFKPSDKTDIFSLGVSLYQIFFGIHPYLAKKTYHYKDYLNLLEGATLKPSADLLKMVGSNSLKLANLVKFLERMIDLNEKTRAGLQDLKEFLQNNPPFNKMKIVEQTNIFENREEVMPISENSAEVYYVSVIKYKNNSEQSHNLPVIEKKQKKSDKLRKKIVETYTKESPYVVGVIMVLINSIDLIRKINFCNLNISPVDKNFLGIDLTTCKVSRLVKYLVYEFSITVVSSYKRRYQGYLQASMEEEIVENEEYLQKEFNKFLIECDFANKEILAEQLKNRENNLNLWMQISKYYENWFKSITIIEENKQKNLLCSLYCLYIPKILNLFSKLKTIFTEQTLEDIEQFPEIGDSSWQDGERTLAQMNEMEKMRAEQLRVKVEQKFNEDGKQFILDLDEDSEEIEVITEEELL